MAVALVSSVYDRDRFGAYAIVHCAARQMSGIGAGDERFSRDAARIDAGTAEELALNQLAIHGCYPIPMRESPS